ncbi:MAG TPA: macro domain-containing protein [Thermoanaerobaculia bacterium]|nr:macro domain-containing protein [Thermoanaerobaculia bacterium]HUM29914.1 macro domain-containing protein [Thermoanaerobaculia bacterium]HXK68219.1 macro domain-containing protein [Thermoanaerobaculia bacterium]
MHYRLGRTLLEILEGDIIARDEDAIVNPANEHLKHGGGVAGQIVRRGGSTIQEESDQIGFCPVGSAVITSAGTLKARRVIHVVGPRWGEGEEDAKLARAVESVLNAAEQENLKTVAMPAISTGIFGFPMERAARIILTVLAQRLRAGSILDRVVLCLYGQEAFDTFARMAQEMLNGR